MNGSNVALSKGTLAPAANPRAMRAAGGVNDKTGILLITGPTASGKSARAVEEALRRGGEVVSADSRQVYEGFDATTAKITAYEMRGVPHHLLSFIPVEKIYTAFDFVRDADRAIAAVASRGKLPIVAGGTMFYIHALLWEGTLSHVPANPSLRAALETQSTEALYQALAERAPRRAAHVHPHDRYRILRALEISETLGAVPPVDRGALRYRVELINLTPPRDELRARIRARVEERLPKILEEIRGAEAALDAETARRLGFDFTLTLRHLRGEITREEFIEALSAKDWQYARRQVRWFSRMERELASSAHNPPSP